jgi:hypothetical protein
VTRHHRRPRRVRRGESCPPFPCPAPRVVGDGYDNQGHEVLTFVEGTFVHPRAWSDDGIWQAGRLLRTLHDATGRLDEVAATAWLNAQLHDDDIAERHALPAAAARAAQLRYFLDGYRLPAIDRDGLVTTMIEYAIRDRAAEAVKTRVTPDSDDPGPLWALAWRGRSAAWTIRNRALLENAIAACPDGAGAVILHRFAARPDRLPTRALPRVTGRRLVVLPLLHLAPQP